MPITSTTRGCNFKNRNTDSFAHVRFKFSLVILIIKMNHTVSPIENDRSSQQSAEINTAASKMPLKVIIQTDNLFLEKVLQVLIWEKTTLIRKEKKVSKALTLSMLMQKVSEVKDEFASEN